METTEKLFSEFAPITREQWKAKAIEDLKGADFNKRLVWKTDDDFPVLPFYTEEDIRDNGLINVQELFSEQSRRVWTNYSYIPVVDLSEANLLATEMVTFGAAGILFHINEYPSVDFNVLLNGLDPQQLHISFCSSHPDKQFLAGYFKYLEQEGTDLKNIKGFYQADVLEEWTTKGTEPDFDSFAEVLKIAQAAPAFKTLVIRSHAFLDAGANTTQELAFTLNKLIDYIDKFSEKGLPLSVIADNLVLHMAIGGDYFFEIAKLRSLKVLLKSVLDLYGLHTAIDILSSNSVWSKSYYDPNVNMLRNTTEAMSALLGGCNALLTYPHDASYSQPTRFSQRIALNVSNLLKEESYFDKVIDPAAGSYYLESLTSNITGHALSLFKEIEAGGGFMESIRNGMIQGKINAIKLKKEKEIATRKRVYVGTNKYPNLKEKATPQEDTSNEANKTGFPLLVPQHAALVFEKLRNRTLKQKEATGFVPKVYLACFGNLAMRKARASFAAEFFGTAGFEILGEFFFNDAQTAAEESANSESEIVVICSSDLEYETHAVAFAEKFKSVSKEKILVLAGYPEKVIDDLKNGGVDTFIHIKSDAIETLSAIQNKLFRSSAGEGSKTNN